MSAARGSYLRGTQSGSKVLSQESAQLIANPAALRHSLRKAFGFPMHLQLLSQAMPQVSPGSAAFPVESLGFPPFIFGSEARPRGAAKPQGLLTSSRKAGAFCARNAAKPQIATSKFLTFNRPAIEFRRILRRQVVFRWPFLPILG